MESKPGYNFGLSKEQIEEKKTLVLYIDLLNNLKSTSSSISFNVKLYKDTEILKNDAGEDVDLNCE